MISRLFVDTNILIYSRDEASPFFPVVRDALQGLVNAGISLCIHRQILREYIAVVTRPYPKGLDATSREALTQIAEFEGFYQVLEDLKAAWEIWKEIVEETGITGLRVHDAYLAAVMKGHQVETILTLNTSDFQMISEISAVEPQNWQTLTIPEEEEESER